MKKWGLLILIAIYLTCIFFVGKYEPLLLTQEDVKNTVLLSRALITIVFIPLVLIWLYSKLFITWGLASLILFIFSFNYITTYQATQKKCICKWYSQPLVIGTVLKDTSNQKHDCETLLKDGTGVVKDIWTEDSINNSNSKLQSDYIFSSILTSSFLISFFAFSFKLISLKLLKKAETIKIEDPNHKIIHTMKKIFISHSSNDILIVEELINLIEIIGVKSDKIFCSSLDGYGVPLGENYLDRLKNELSDEVMVLFIFTDNFYKSPICLCEMGATWVKTNKHIPILIPPFDFQNVKGVFPTTQGFKINEPLKLNSLKQTLEIEFQIPTINSSIWEQKRDKMLSRVNDLINKTE